MKLSWLLLFIFSTSYAQFEVSPAVWIERAISYHEAKKFKKAIEAYSKALEMDNKNGDVYYNRGSAYDDTGNLSRAIKDYTTAAKLKPKMAYAYFNMAYAYERIKNRKKAAENYNLYLKFNEDKDRDAKAVRDWIRKLGYPAEY